MPKKLPKRRRVFVGCEGDSERAYAALVRRLLEQQHQKVHLDHVILRPGGGDPLALMKLAAKHIKQASRDGVPYVAKFLLLDSDKLGISPNNDQSCLALAAASGATLIWQETAHEAFLLRHLANSAALRPPTTTVAYQQLKARWPQYQKPMTADQLGRRIDRPAILQASQVELSLTALLTTIGFI